MLDVKILNVDTGLFSWYRQKRERKKRFKTKKKLRQLRSILKDRSDKCSHLAAIHLLAVHEIRRFVVGGHGWGESGLKSKSLVPFRELADKCRDSMAGVLGINSEALHCTIKVCQGTNELNKGDWKVWTVARSESFGHFRERTELGPDYSHLVKENSSFASLVGCPDNKINWPSTPHLCFGCNNLPCCEKYAETRDRDIWEQLYSSALVFPLRYSYEGKKRHAIMGFLTFDSLYEGVFEGVPSIFDYVDEPNEYWLKLSGSSAFHAGCIMADILATAVAYKKGK